MLFSQKTRHKSVGILGQVEWVICELLRRELLVEQRGVEPLTSALRTRRSAKLSYCPTRVAILGTGESGVKGASRIKGTLLGRARHD